MTCEEAKFKLQALVDDELENDDITDTVAHIESCADCREEYVELLKLRKKMKEMPFPEPPPEWFEELQKKIPRRVTSFSGKVLFFGSYLVLGAYTAYSLIFGSHVSVFIKLGVSGLICGLVVLLGVTIADRVKESKTDKYKGVMK